MRKIRDKYQVYFIYLALAIATRAVYWQVHSFEFVNYDDARYVSKNEHISSGLAWKNIVWVFTKEHVGNWHPLTGLSHMLDCRLFGLKPGLHHLVNLLFHIVNTLLLFNVLRQMTGTVWQSSFVAALFALHPLHVESVAWISERKDVLSTLFWILAMAAYLRYVKTPKAGSYILTLTLFALGLMAKPMLVTLPFVLLLLDYWPLNRLQIDEAGKIKWHFLRHLIWEKIPFLILSAISSIVTFFVQKSAGTVGGLDFFPLTVRLANAVVSYAKYIGKMIWPAHLAAFYPYPLKLWSVSQVLAAIVLLSVITILVIRLGKKYKYLPVGWFWYLGTLVPVIGLVKVGIQSMADRYTYVPLIGLFIIIAWGITDLLKHWKYRQIAFGVSSIFVILVLSICTWVQTSYWRNSRALFEHALKVTTDNYVAYSNLGTACEKLGRYDEAIEAYKQVIRIRPYDAEAYYNLGIASGALGRYQEAIDACQQAIRIKPDYAMAFCNLGAVYHQLGRYQEAIDACKQAVRIEPDLAEAHFNLGVTYSALGRDQEALEAYKQVIGIKPDDSQAYNNLGDTYDKLGRLQDAIEAYVQAIRIKPDYAAAHYGLGAAYLSAGDRNAAIEQYKILKTINPALADQLYKRIYK